VGLLVRAKQQKYQELFKDSDSAHQEVEVEIKILEWEVWLYKLDQDLEPVHLEVEVEQECHYKLELDLVPAHLEAEVD